MELIGTGKSYSVPPYQRDYSWSEEEWEDLWNDIVELMSDTQDHHYMGALVIQEKSDREFMVIDGQKRLATLSAYSDRTGPPIPIEVGHQSERSGPPYQPVFWSVDRCSSNLEAV